MTDETAPKRIGSARDRTDGILVDLQTQIENLLDKSSQMTYIETVNAFEVDPIAKWKSTTEATTWRYENVPQLNNDGVIYFLALYKTPDLSAEDNARLRSLSDLLFDEVRRTFMKSDIIHKQFEQAANSRRTSVSYVIAEISHREGREVDFMLTHGYFRKSWTEVFPETVAEEAARTGRAVDISDRLREYMTYYVMHPTEVSNVFRVLPQ